MLSRYYLPLRQDVITKYVYEKFGEKSNLDCMQSIYRKRRSNGILVECINYYTCQRQAQ